MKRKVVTIPELAAVGHLAFELNVTGFDLAAAMRKDGVFVIEFKIGKSVARLVRRDDYESWLARRAGFGPAFDQATPQE